MIVRVLRHPLHLGLVASDTVLHLDLAQAINALPPAMTLLKWIESRLLILIACQLLFGRRLPGFLNLNFSDRILDLN